jgi:hypothetical protein
MCYISSNNNRVYVSLETAYGTVPAVTTQNRIPLVKLAAKQVPEQTGRRDKTGSRTFVGLPNRIRKKTNFQLNTFMTEWADQSQPPRHSPLFQAALGAAPLTFTGGTVASITSQTTVHLTAAHGLNVGQGVSFGGEMRFVAAIADDTTIVLNAPFTNLAAGGVLGTTVTFSLSSDVGSVSLFDYWDPATVVQRIVNGAAINTIKVEVNGDFQEFVFAGPSKDLIDNTSFTDGQGALTSYPTEPVDGGFDYTIVPGHLGQVWMGALPTRFFTLTKAELQLDNGIDLRVKEFGNDSARCIAGGQRTVTLNLQIFEQDDDQTKGLYQSARQRSPISVMLQLGEQPGQLFGAYMPAMVPEVPEFDDSETRLQWKFQNSRGQGSVNDELYIAFG